MRIKSSYVLREVGGTHVVVPTGKASLDFSGVITLNNTGAFLWKRMVEGETLEELVDALVAEYEVEHGAAQNDIKEFLNKLKAVDLFE